MTLQDEQLFGAPPGDLVGVTLGVSFHDTGSVTVVLHGHTVMRQKLMTLRVRHDDKANTSSIIGALTPILVRASGMTAAGMRRHLWAAHNRLGRLGFEVSIENCGREPKH